MIIKMNSFYGTDRENSYFEGWYLKHQCKAGTVSLIPAFHVDSCGEKSASLQVITDENSYAVDFPIEDFKACTERFCVKLGQNLITERGCKLDIATKELTIKGILQYGKLTPLAYDIMGPFALVPFMQCRHRVLSVYHSVSGKLNINGKLYEFHKEDINQKDEYIDCGYIEGDRGSSFPSKYIWTQCNWDKNCIMLSAAQIPFFGGGFIGCIAVVFYRGKEYRIATYLGAKLFYCNKKSLLVVQGDLFLQVDLVEDNAHSLRAPQSGSMNRTIHESASCKVRYKFKIKDESVLDFVGKASFEKDWE